MQSTAEKLNQGRLGGIDMGVKTAQRNPLENQLHMSLSRIQENDDKLGLSKEGLELKLLEELVQGLSLVTSVLTACFCLSENYFIITVGY